MNPRARSLFLTLLLTTGILTIGAPTAEAYGSENPHYYVGRNWLHGGSHIILNGQFSTFGQTCNLLYCATDGATWTYYTSMSNTTSPGGCYGGTGTWTQEIRTPDAAGHLVDHLRINADIRSSSGSFTTGCLRAYGLIDGTTDYTFATEDILLNTSGPGSTYTIDSFVNFTPKTYYGVVLEWSGTGFGVNREYANIYEIELRGKNDTTEWYPRLVADSFALSGTSSTNNALNTNLILSYPGTYDIVHYLRTDAEGNPESTLETASFTASVGGSITVINSTFSKVAGSSAGNACIAKTTRFTNSAYTNTITFNSGAVGIRVCYFDNATAQLYAPSPNCTNLSGCAFYDGDGSVLEVLALLYDAQTAPPCCLQNDISPPDDTELIPTTPTNCWRSFEQCFTNISLRTELTLGAQPGETFTRSWTDDIPGNALLLLLGQNKTAGAEDIDSAVTITVNGIETGALWVENDVTQSGGGKANLALFYLDDAARRNNVTLTNLTFQGFHRPFAREQYTITIGEGFDEDDPLYAANTTGVYGHSVFTCDSVGLCATSHALSNFVLAGAVNNTVAFAIRDCAPQTTCDFDTASPLSDVVVTDTRTDRTNTTDTSGRANFTQVTQTTKYTIVLPGYEEVCARYYYTTSSTTTSGFDSDGCVFIQARNLARFNIVLRTLEQAGLDGNGTFEGDFGEAPQVITFNVTDPEYVTGQLVQIQINRTVSENLYVTYWFINANGDPIIQGDPAPWLSTHPDTVAFSNPDDRLLDARDTGRYILAVYNHANVSTVAYTRVGVNADSDFPVSTTLITTITTQTALQITTSVVTQARVEAETTAYDDYLAAVSWAYRTDLFLPNMWFILILFMVAALVLRFARN